MPSRGWLCHTGAGQAQPASQTAPAGRGARGAAPADPTVRPNLPADIKNVAKDSRCFELRTYTVQEGASIDLLHSRFRDHTVDLFKKHGIMMIGFWQPVTKLNTLTYLLAYKDGAARDASWAAFQADPEWRKVLAAMPVHLQVESVFMSAADYSPLK